MIRWLRERLPTASSGNGSTDSAADETEASDVVERLVDHVVHSFYSNNQK